MSTLKTNAIVDAAGGNTTTVNGNVPLAQGGGVGMGANKVYIGWASAGSGDLLAQVDVTSIGALVRKSSAVTTGGSSELVAPGNAPIYACRAWVNFSGVTTTTIRAHGNVSSVVRNAAGDYTINFVVSMPDTNYAVTGTCRIQGFAQPVVSVNGVAGAATSGVRVSTVREGPVAADAEQVHIAIFR